MSADLQWLLLRGNNSFMVKRVAGGPVFSKEPGNLRNLHSYKYSGLANPKIIDVSESESVLGITTSKESADTKKSASKKSRYNRQTIRQRSGPRRSLGVAAACVRAHYRPDLRAAMLARVSALLRAQKEPKPTPAKKLRGKHAQTKTS